MVTAFYIFNFENKLETKLSNVGCLSPLPSRLPQKGGEAVVLTVKTVSLLRGENSLHQPISGRELELMLEQVAGMEVELEQDCRASQGEEREEMKRS